MNLFKHRSIRFFLILTIPFFLINTAYLRESNQNKDNPEIGTDKYFFETTETESADQTIADQIKDIFPIISESDLNKIISSKVITEINSESYDSLTGFTNEIKYKISFDVPKNFTVDTAKILWTLNIPSFESKIYQLYSGQQIYIDTWPNVVGKISTKTYTGNFEAYKVRNYPFYKDPDPSKASLPPTKPGPGNPLGLFVVHYDQNSLRYFHGTNQNKLLSNEMRNLSHGCVRNDNDNIAKMKEFLIKRVIKSKDLSDWLGSKRTLVYELEDIDKFPVKITYHTFEMGKDGTGEYIILYKDVYNYSNPNNIHDDLDDPGLIMVTNKENMISEFKKNFGDEIKDEALNLVIDYVIESGEKYQKYYLEDLKTKFLLNN